MGAWLARARKALQRMKISDPNVHGDDANLGPRYWRRNSSPSKQIKRAGKYQKAKLIVSGDPQHCPLSSLDASGSEHSVTDSRTPSPSPMLIRQQRIRTLEETRPNLTKEQITLLRTTWRVIQTHTATVGYDMFNRLFRAYPDIQSAFPHIKVLDPAEAKYREDVMTHGTRVLDTIELMLSKIYDVESLVEEVHALGRKHVAFNAKVDYIDLIGPQFLFAVEPILFGYWSNEVEQAWMQLFKFVGHIMREAMIM